MEEGNPVDEGLEDMLCEGPEGKRVLIQWLL
jgi:hypothetical protein